jgi:hypothetical protein
VPGYAQCRPVMATVSAALWPSILDPFKPHPDQRTAQGCDKAARLFRDLAALGHSTVRDVTSWFTCRRTR